MRSVSRFRKSFAGKWLRTRPRRCRPRSPPTVGVWLRLTFCLVVLLGHGHVSSQDTTGVSRDVAAGAVESDPDRIDGIGRDVDRGGAIVVKGDDPKLEGEDKYIELTAREGGEAKELFDEGAGVAADEISEVLSRVGACVGRRFKKCR